jgi:hypothetical protein
MVADEFQRSARADFGNRIKVIAAEEDAEVDKLATDMISV